MQVFLACSLLHTGQIGAHVENAYIYISWEPGELSKDSISSTRQYTEPIMLGCCLWSWVSREGGTQAAEFCLGHYNPQLHALQQQLNS